MSECLSVGSNQTSGLTELDMAVLVSRDIHWLIITRLNTSRVQSVNKGVISEVSGTPPSLAI